VTKRLITAGLFALLVTAGFAATALAKGPETGTLSGPGIEMPIVFLDQTRPHETYDVEPPITLLEVTGLWYAPVPGEATPLADLGEPYTVQWVNMGGGSLIDRTIVQHIYLDAEGGPLIHTPDQIGLERWGDGVVGWFKAKDGIEKAIDAVMEWAGESPTEKPKAAPWTLPAIALAAVIGLIGLGRRLTP
jgi:hypothetical protein